MDTTPAADAVVSPPPESRAPHHTVRFIDADDGVLVADVHLPEVPAVGDIWSQPSKWECADLERWRVQSREWRSEGGRLDVCLVYVRDAEIDDERERERRLEAAEDGPDLEAFGELADQFTAVDAELEALRPAAEQAARVWGYAPEGSDPITTIRAEWPQLAAALDHLRRVAGRQASAGATSVSTSKWRVVIACPAVHPETGGMCEVERPAEGVEHDRQHCHTEWRDGEPVGPVYWSDAPTLIERLPPPEQVAVLAYVGNVYGLADRCGVHSTHRESDLFDRLHAAGYEIVRVKPAQPPAGEETP